MYPLVPGTVEKRVRDGLTRLRNQWFYILQAGIAAGASYWAGVHIFNHPHPFFAPMATVIVLSTAGGERLRRAVELVVGVSLGVGLGDLLIETFGSGVWQIAVGVTLAIALGTFIDRGVLVANQAAFAAVLVATILPPSTSGGPDRMVDAFVGGLVGLVVIALLPQSPLKPGRNEVSQLLQMTSQVLAQVAAALRTGDVAGIEEALNSARGTQGAINSMIATARAGKENIVVSPLLWRQRKKIESLMRLLNPVDNAMRNTRVLARRALVLAEDHDEVSDDQLYIIEELASVADELHRLFHGDDKEYKVIPEQVKRLRVLGSMAGLDTANEHVLSAQIILGQSRSIIVDLLQICGLSRRSAIATLKPTSSTPAQPPEIWGSELPLDEN
ncbi:FUSC family protein [Corynebacterium sp. ES2794-CONJ1]|uniref:FUSC family protein n=1 Tax=unclassified Corynebacterium TaxID=2624378 RepID=UPI0021674DBC|nr:MULTISPECIES: FUSC family protein [unclassified Corynebacterium]MCS4490195.1 FUSC family protein [Corynebacterium sp. ES2775-CONJ]MCS4491994.1 FUSC family protein [Corynebacterium sp. ES2715-CONJ3]MCS4532098.1 FUSC family protein [Corynebacterium sp. ES2730-CONJ]MCU9519500.1 FUSC family protein [Corynebacterium sp. ES2794-CONJ1]